MIISGGQKKNKICECNEFIKHFLLDSTLVNPGKQMVLINFSKLSITWNKENQIETGDFSYSENSIQVEIVNSKNYKFKQIFQ